MPPQVPTFPLEEGLYTLMTKGTEAKLERNPFCSFCFVESTLWQQKNGAGPETVCEDHFRRWREKCHRNTKQEWTSITTTYCGFLWGQLEKIVS